MELFPLYPLLITALTKTTSKVCNDSPSSQGILEIPSMQVLMKSICKCPLEGYKLLFVGIVIFSDLDRVLLAYAITLDVPSSCTWYKTAPRPFAGISLQTKGLFVISIC